MLTEHRSALHNPSPSSLAPAFHHSRYNVGPGPGPHTAQWFHIYRSIVSYLSLTRSSLSPLKVQRRRLECEPFAQLFDVHCRGLHPDSFSQSLMSSCGRLTLPILLAQVHQIAFSPDSSMLAVAGGENCMLQCGDNGDVLIFQTYGAWPTLLPRR